MYPATVSNHYRLTKFQRKEEVPMNQTNQQLHNIITNLHALADSLQVLADSMEHENREATAPTVPTPPTKPKKPVLTLVDVRTVL